MTIIKWDLSTGGNGTEPMSGWAGLMFVQALGKPDLQVRLNESNRARHPRLVGCMSSHEHACVMLVLYSLFSKFVAIFLAKKI